MIILIILIIIMMKMSMKMSKKCPRHKKRKNYHVWDQKWVARPNRPQPQEPPRPIFDDKKCSKNISFNVQDIFFDMFY